MLHLTNYLRVLTALLLLNLLLSGCDRRTFVSDQEFPKIVTGKAKPSRTSEDPDSKTSLTLSSEQAISKAKLTPEQARKIISVLGISKNFVNDNVVVLPTYIPDGYTVNELIVWQGLSTAKRGTLAGYYEIVYKNSYGACFKIGGGEIIPRGEGMENYEEISNIQSPALGSIKLGFTDSSREDGSKSIVFAETMSLHREGRNEYNFYSPFYGNFIHADSDANFNKSRQDYSSCKMMKLQDAKRVVQSLQFINP